MLLTRVNELKYWLQARDSINESKKGNIRQYKRFDRDPVEL